MRPTPILGYEYIPNSDLKINSYGLIGREYRLEKNENTCRILLLGDSILAQGYSSVFLESLLNERRRLRSEQTFEVWNAGVPSWDVRKDFLYLKHTGLNIEPDMVIIFLFMNDFDLNTNIYYKTKNGTIEYHFSISEISKLYIPNPLLMKHPYLYRFIVLNLDSFLISKSKNQDLDWREKQGSHYLKRIKEICQKRDILLFVAIFPYIVPLNEYEDWQLDQYSKICKVTKDLEIPHLNLYNLYVQLIEEGFPLREKEDDDIHPSKEGHRLIVEKIIDYTTENFLNFRRCHSLINRNSK